MTFDNMFHQQGLGYNGQPPARSGSHTNSMHEVSATKVLYRVADVHPGRIELTHGHLHHIVVSCKNCVVQVSKRTNASEGGLRRTQSARTDALVSRILTYSCTHQALHPLSMRRC